MKGCCKPGETGGNHHTQGLIEQRVGCLQHPGRPWRLSLQSCACCEGPRRCPPASYSQRCSSPAKPPADVPGQGRISAAPMTDRHTPLPQHSQDKLTTHVCSETGEQTLHVLNRSLCRNHVFHRTQSFFTLINPNSKVLQGKVRSPFSSEWKAKKPTTEHLEARA